MVPRRRVDHARRTVAHQLDVAVHVDPVQLDVVRPVGAVPNPGHARPRLATVHGIAVEWTRRVDDAPVERGVARCQSPNLHGLPRSVPARRRHGPPNMEFLRVQQVLDAVRSLPDLVGSMRTDNDILVALGVLAVTAIVASLFMRSIKFAVGAVVPFVPAVLVVGVYHYFILWKYLDPQAAAEVQAEMSQLRSQLDLWRAAFAGAGTPSQ